MFVKEVVDKSFALAPLILNQFVPSVEYCHWYSENPLLASKACVESFTETVEPEQTSFVAGNLIKPAWVAVKVVESQHQRYLQRE